MIDSVVSLLHFVLTVLGLAGNPDPGVIGVTVAVALALTLVTLAAASHAVPEPGGTSAAHPRRAIDVSAPLPQSDPDASGHPRPRAPQRAVSAA